jgi:ribosomal protein S18 acetylase RimI-like enzyme
VDLPVTVRDLEPTDLPALGWTGDAQHLTAIAGDLAAAWAGQVIQLVVELPNAQLVGFGAVDFRRAPGFGLIWMLSVHELLQSLGLGTMLITALEDRIRQHGRDHARIAVEQDNPRAAALYRRLGYTECGSVVDSWPIGAHRHYVTVCSLLERRLPAPSTGGH